MTDRPDHDRPNHELQVLEVDQSVPPRPEEEVADAGLVPEVANADPSPD
jgi:hypothetical protein